jgi:TolA-binding protein
VPADHHDAIRAKLVARTVSDPSAPIRWKVVAIAAAAAIAFVAIDRLPEGPVHRGRVRPLDEAKLFVAGAQPDEIVRLQHGAIMVDVDPLEPGERFRIVTSDAEIEVVGTTFDVAADRDRLRSVRVISGRVEVRIDGSATVLSAGDRWTAPAGVEAPKADIEAPKAVVGVAPAEDARTPSARPAPPRAPSVPVAVPKRKPAPRVASAPPPPPAPSPPPSIDRYEVAWSLLRDGALDAAAEAFAQAAVEAKDPGTREDAAFFAAVALARARRSPEAIRSFERDLADHGTSARAGEAAAMVGWLLFDAGETQRAVERFERAASDPSPRVRKSAEEGLAAVRSR